MTERMYRAQILLEPSQQRKLEEIARREGKSISAVTRQVIDAGLASFENEIEIWKKRACLLANLRANRDKQNHEYGGDLINETRDERDDEMDPLRHSYL